MSEARIFASTNPQYDNKLFIFHESFKLKMPAEHVVYTNCCFCFVLTFRTILVHNMFCRCCKLLKKIYLYIMITGLHFKDLTRGHTFKLPTFFGHYSTNLITVDFSTHVVFYRVFTNQVGWSKYFFLIDKGKLFW